MAHRERLRPGDDIERGAEPVAAALDPDPRARVLALQRSAGNAAVAKLLRDDKKKPPPPIPPRTGGWNEAARAVAGALRLIVTGLKRGNQQADASWNTRESAAGRAIVVVPDGVDLGASPDVLLFFHGMGNEGFRERTSSHSSRGPEGTVHDVEADRIEQQLAHSGRNIVGVLPQGTNAATFGIADPKAYVDEVLAGALAQLPALRPGAKLPAAITPGRIIVSGHSGGGRAAQAAAKTLTAKPPATDDAWVHAPPLFMFDGINGTAELDALAALVTQWLQADLVRLKASPDPGKLLDRRGIKLRSTHTNTAVYEALNVGGKYMATEYLEERDEQGRRKTREIQVTISADRSLKGRIDAWFANNAAPLAAVQAKWRAQYDVPDAALPGRHESTVGTGELETDPKKRTGGPAGVTDPSQKAGVPSYGGGGRLEDALSHLPADALRPPPPAPQKHSMLEEPAPEEVPA
jgi:hypothetical protein